MYTASRKSFGMVYLGLGGILAISGCGGPFDASANGVVTFDGKAVPRGTVSFHPVSGGPTAYAAIGANGEYAMHTGRENGLPSGQYQVSVTANEPAAAAQTAKGGPPPPGKSITPEWYRMKETSGLSVTVNPGTNDIPLTLTSTPPAGWKPGNQK